MGKANIPTDAEIEAIRVRSTAENAREIRAEGVRLLPKQRAIEFMLAARGSARNAFVIVPLDVEPQLVTLTSAQLAELEVYPSGTTLACESANLHLSVEALILRALMGPDYHQRLRSVGAAAMGRVSSPAKTAAVRANGAKGGRPRKALPQEPTPGLVPKAAV